jgi:hypothetical protein
MARRRRKTFTKRDAKAAVGLLALISQLLIWFFGGIYVLLNAIVRLFGRSSSERPAGAISENRHETTAPSPKPVLAPCPVAVPRPSPRGPSGSSGQPGQSRWIPVGETVEVKGRTIPGGMFYLGSGLKSIGSEWSPEPALVDPNRTVSLLDESLSERRLSYWPSYREASPEARRAYLQWLAGGRQASDADIGYVFLFFYGLERRVFHDAERDASLRDEFPAIEAELRRLLEIYGGNGSFRGYASSLLNALSCSSSIADGAEATVPPIVPGDFGLSFKLKMGLGRMAADKRPIPAEWAFAWLRSDPNIRLRTPAHRCPKEFQRLFETVYSRHHGPGFVLPMNKTRLKVMHRFASPSFNRASGVASIRVDLPDVSVLSSPVKQLQALADECMAALDGYSRLLGRNPDAVNSADALGELPAVLWPQEVLVHLYALSEEAQSAGGRLARSFSDIFAPFPAWRQLTKTRFSALLARLEEHSIGLEPDTRYGGAIPEARDTVVFFCSEASNAVISKAYHAAALALRLAVAVAAADGTVCENERELLYGQSRAWPGLTEAERTRLAAHLAWLLEVRPGLTGVNKRLEGLSTAEKEALGRFLALVAQADAVLDPREVSVLEKLYKNLGLDAGILYSTLHAAPASVEQEPVAVRPAQAAVGFVIPARQAASQAKTCGISLDMAKVAALQVESERTAAILESVFTSDEFAPEPANIAPEEPEETSEDALMGLDAVHSAFWRVLVGRESWTRAELEEMAQERGLMLNGALECLNEAALEAFDIPLCEGDDPVEINVEVREGVLQ